MKAKQIEKRIEKVEMQAVLEWANSQLEKVYTALDRIEGTLANIEEVLYEICEKYGIDLYREVTYEEDTKH